MKKLKLRELEDISVINRLCNIFRGKPPESMLEFYLLLFFYENTCFRKKHSKTALILL